MNTISIIAITVLVTISVLTITIVALRTFCANKRSRDTSRPTRNGIWGSNINFPRVVCNLAQVPRSRGTQRKRARERGKRHEEIQMLSNSQVMERLRGTCAAQNFIYAQEYADTHPLDTSERPLSDEQIEHIVENGADAWEFCVTDENSGVFTTNRTEVDFTDGEQSILTNLPFPNEQHVYYFEIRLDNIPSGTNVAVGVSMKGYPPLRMAGWSKSSVAYHTKDGCIYYTHPLDISQKVETSRSSDTLGVGWRPYSGKIFFVINGAVVCRLRTNWSQKRMYPIVSADGPCSISANFGSRAFVLAHANMRYWGLAPSEGIRPPPPLYQNSSECILLESGSMDSVDYPQNLSSNTNPPPYEHNRIYDDEFNPLYSDDGSISTLESERNAIDNDSRAYLIRQNTHLPYDESDTTNTDIPSSSKLGINKVCSQSSENKYLNSKTAVLGKRNEINNLDDSSISLQIQQVEGCSSQIQDSSELDLIHTFKRTNE